MVLEKEEGIEKIAFASASDFGPSILFDSGKDLEKKAEELLPEVERFAANIKGSGTHTWLLVHAIGASEAYGANRNGDWTSEKALNHVPKDWTGEPAIDKVIAKDWIWGWPTYYNAHVYANHVNKDPNKSIGSVEFVCWNAQMMRVELILKIAKERAKQFGGGWALDRMDAGRLLDVSMGMRVPFDLSNREIDWDKYNKARATYDPSVHRSEGLAVLAFHRKDPIPGLSRTRNDYTNEVKMFMNKVYPDGSKTFVHNMNPKFFDLSMVFVGAEKPAKVMKKLASRCEISGIKCASCRGKNCIEKVVPPSAYLPEIMGAAMSKTASVTKSAVAKKVGRLLKKSEIVKKTPSTFEDASVAAMADREEDLPRDVLDQMAKNKTDEALSTPAMLGIKLKPKEFQRITLIRIGKRSLADDLDDRGEVFRPVDDVPKTRSCIRHSLMLPLLSKILAPFMSGRSAFGPALRSRITIIIDKKPSDPLKEVADPLLDKISAAYNAYERDLAENFEKEASIAIHQNMLIRDQLFGGMVKEGSSIIDEFSLEYVGVRRCSI